MILELLFKLLNVIGWLYDLIVPGFIIPEEYLEPIDQMIEAAMKFDGLIPVSTALNALKYIFLFEFCMLTAKIVFGIANYVRGVGSISIE